MKKQFKQPSDFTALNLYLRQISLNKDILSSEVYSKRANAKPILFQKKINSRVKTIPLELMRYPSGHVRHFPSESLEWHNSVYSYNSNYMKSLASADENLINTFRSYLGLRFKRKQKDKRIERSLTSHIYLKKYRLSGGKYMRKLHLSTAQKIFVSKGSVKHTNDSAIVTLFIYNAQKFRLIATAFDPLYINYIWNKETLKQEQDISYDSRIIRLYEKLYKQYKNKSIIKDINKVKYKIRLSSRKLFWRYYFTMPKVLKLLLLIYKLKINLNDTHIKNRPKSQILLYSHYFNDSFENPISKLHLFKLKKNPFIVKNRAIKKILRIHNKFNRFLLFIMLNEKKFEQRYLENLRKFACKIYNKNVIFNIINLGKSYLNSNIFTQIITLKLRDRKNTATSTLKKCLAYVEQPRVDVMKYRIPVDINKVWANKMNIHIFDVLSKKTSNEHLLDQIIYKDRPLVNPLSLFAEKQKIKKSFIKKFIRRIYKTIKDKKFAGIKIRAKGRLTRRFKAARSITKMKSKGGFRNLEASYQGVSSVMMRGNLLPNVDQTTLTYKRRIGAYGVKGWIASM